MIPPLKVVPAEILENIDAWLPGYPVNYKYATRFSTSKFISTETIEIVSQFFSGSDYWAELLTVNLKKDTRVNLIVHYPSICLALFLKGNIKGKLADQKFLLAAQTMRMFYLPAGLHNIHLIKDEYSVLFFIPPIEYLEEIAAEDNTLQRLLAKLTEESRYGDVTENLNFSIDISKTILSIEKRQLSTASLRLVVRQHILKLLTIYHDQLTTARDHSSGQSSQQKVYHVREYILNNLADPSLGSLKEFAKMFYVSRRTLSTEFKILTGQSITEFITSRRLQWAVELLATTDKRVFEIALTVGYNDVSSFTRKFKKKYGYSPGKRVEK